MSGSFSRELSVVSLRPLCVRKFQWLLYEDRRESGGSEGDRPGTDYV